MSPVACRRPRSCWQALLLAAAALAAGPASAAAEWSIGIQVPGISIGVNVPRYPQLVPVPGFPVYYAPEVRSNFFFYDGVYWVYQGDRWYASTWYNGPWGAVSPDAVPWSVLRVPVRYYRSPPPHFRGWQREAPPRWEEHWGPEWHGPRDGWRRDDREAFELRSPLPSYQRQYPSQRYPPPTEQRALHERYYRYEPREAGRGAGPEHDNKQDRKEDRKEDRKADRENDRADGDKHKPGKK